MNISWNNILWLLFIVIILLSIALLPVFKQKSYICCNNECFEIELAKTEHEKAQGLMYRETLEEKKGMIFIYEEEKKYSFWMKNTLIPLDMIWINNNLTIVDIKQANPCKKDPCSSFIPKENAQYVLELNQGISQKYGIHIGDQCILSL